VYHGDCGVEHLRELIRNYRQDVQDCTRVKNRIKAIYRSRGIVCEGEGVYCAEEREEWLGELTGRGVRARASSLYAQLDLLMVLREEAEKLLVEESKKYPARKYVQG